MDGFMLIWTGFRAEKSKEAAMDGFMLTFEVRGYESVFEALEQAIHRAACRFEGRTGKKAQAAWVNPADVPALAEGERLRVGGLVVRPKASVLPRHVWVGVEDE